MIISYIKFKVSQILYKNNLVTASFIMFSYLKTWQKYYAAYFIHNKTKDLLRIGYAIFNLNK